MSDPVADSLLEYRKHFPALEECVHFISHSLGCVPAQAKEDLATFFEQWRTKSITAWGEILGIESEKNRNLSREWNQGARLDSLPFSADSCFIMVTGDSQFRT